MVKYVVRSLGALLADAQERGLIVRNPVRELRRRHRKGGKQERRNGKLKVGIDIPTPDEIRTHHQDCARQMASVAANRDLHRPSGE